MICIEELMGKEYLSGEDIGKLIISNDICIYKKQMGDEEFADYEPLSQEVLDSFTEKIDSYEALLRGVIHFTVVNIELSFLYKLILYLLTT